MRYRNKGPGPIQWLLGTEPAFRLAKLACHVDRRIPPPPGGIFLGGVPRNKGVTEVGKDLCFDVKTPHKNWYLRTKLITLDKHHNSYTPALAPQLACDSWVLWILNNLWLLWIKANPTVRAASKIPKTAFMLRDSPSKWILRHIIKNISKRPVWTIYPCDPQVTVKKVCFLIWNERTFPSLSFRLKREQRKRQREGSRQGQRSEVRK